MATQPSDQLNGLRAATRRRWSSGPKSQTHPAGRVYRVTHSLSTADGRQGARPWARGLHQLLPCDEVDRQGGSRSANEIALRSYGQTARRDSYLRRGNGIVGYARASRPLPDDVTPHLVRRGTFVSAEPLAGIA